MAEAHKLGDLQHSILRVLWHKKEATVVDVLAALSDERDRALTTIATMLTKMEKRKLVAHRSEGRQFVYRALVSESQVRRSMIAELTSRLFAGDTTALVSHLLEEHEIDSTEVERLRTLIAEQGKRERGSGKEKRRGR
ncbi:MAG: BlaI/MecI/CopY family transcriptional regulator [Planctomycetes bacterium]|nr:BlaI/MecI/CopY family transcriptional regulator [Planctomycetota bacterium]